MKAIFAAPAVLLAAAHVAAAQDKTPPPANPQTDSRLDKLEKRFDDLEHKYDADTKAKDEEIARLKEELAKRPATSQSVTSGAASTDAAATDIDKSTEDMLKDIDSNKELPVTQRIPASFNPNFAVVSDFLGSYSSDNANPARNRFDVREVELDLRAAVDPRADAVVILPFSRDVDDPLIFDPMHRNGDVNSSFDIEEAYLFLHDFGVPNLTVKLGRFHLRFGRQNLLHKHDWPTSDNTFVNQSFLGPESLNDSGASFSYVVPPNLIGGQYVEADAEIIAGEGDAADPVLNNNAFVSSPGFNGHVLWNHDVARDWNVELGGSFLYGHHNNDNHQYGAVYGTDVTVIHTDPTGRFDNQLIEFEAMYGDVNSARDMIQHSYGAYLLAQQQIGRDWYLGCRFDYTKAATNEHQEVWGISPYVTWYWSEFLRFRTEFQHKEGKTPTENTLYFQVTWIFGAHPPHPYWAMK